MKENVFALMQRSVENDIRALELLLECMDEGEYRKAVDLLAGSRMTVTTACGSSGFAAKKFAHSLCCIECPAKFVAPSEGLHGGMGVLQPGDVLVAVSKGGKTDELLPMLAQQQIPLYATALREDTRDIRDADLRRAAVVIGSEGRGVSDAVLERCEMTLKIPMRERCESLNAAMAAGIVLWESWR